MTPSENLASRLRLVGVAGLSGAVAGGVAFVAVFSYSGDAFFASTQTFAVGTLAFGFGLLGWSGSVLAGDAVEGMQRYLDTGTNWTEARSRRAMARIAGFGAGWMIGSQLAAIPAGV